MQLVSDIKTVHIELTDKCQAQCPMCARNFHGGEARPFIRNGDISLEQFKEWFPREFLAQLTNFFAGGNYGDPVFARDCLEIYAYIRECNPTARLAIHTNGGMRNPEWWRKLAQYNINVVFAVDGFKGKHELYRKNTNFDKVIENLTAYCAAGGKASVDSLVFAHNEHEVDELEKYLLTLGVESVNFVSTTRFYDMSEYEVLDENEEVEYTIKPAQSKRFKQTPLKGLNEFADEDFRRSVIKVTNIEPKCTVRNTVYIDSHGNLFPCPWIGGDYLETPIKEKLQIDYLRNLCVNSTKKMLKDIGVPNCKDGVLDNTKILFERLPEYWQGENKCLTCIRQCSKIVYDIDNKYSVG